ncbi:MAG: c-type cytochrome [Kiloniellales bacterium]
MVRKVVAIILSVALMALAPGLVAGHGNEVHEGEAKEQTVPAAQPSPGKHRMMGSDRMSTPGMANMRMPRMDPVRGRRLFVAKGCVACHAINGVGGHDATNLDAHTMQPMMNPFEFAAKMWAMAPAMIYAQEEALGEQILFTGDELADIIGFVHNDVAQHDFGEADLTPQARAMMHHNHGEADSGPKAHAKEIGHLHGEGQSHGHGGTGAEGQSN